MNAVNLPHRVHAVNINLVTVPTARDSYHHGDLANALVGAGTELAREGGPQAVVLREVARRLGVSPTAAYRHFADRPALLAAVRERCHDTLLAAMHARLGEVDAEGGDPRRLAFARFRATGRGYLDFALAEPGLFATLFDLSVAAAPRASSGGPTGLATDPACSVTEADTNGDAGPDALPRGATFGLLSASLDELAEAGLLDPARRPGAEIPAWAGVHGLAMLFHGPLRGMDLATREHLINQTLDAIGRGL